MHAVFKRKVNRFSQDVSCSVVGYKNSSWGYGPFCSICLIKLSHVGALYAHMEHCESHLCAFTANANTSVAMIYRLWSTCCPILEIASSVSSVSSWFLAKTAVFKLWKIHLFSNIVDHNLHYNVHYIDVQDLSTRQEEEWRSPPIHRIDQNLSGDWDTMLVILQLHQVPGRLF